MAGTYHKPRELTNVSLSSSSGHAVSSPVSEPVLTPFVFWDGEAVTDGAGYCLFGNSEGHEICYPNLGTKDLLEFILDCGRQIGRAFHVAFAFDYDVNNILRDLPWTALIMLKETGQCQWNGYRLKHIPGKSFTVKKDRTTVRIDDCFTYFRCRFDKALAKYKVCSESELRDISAGKDNRAYFRWGDVDENIRPYWKLELKHGVRLMDKVRHSVNAAGISIGSWHGPGALAAKALKMHDMKEHMSPTLPEMLQAVRIGYAGGWFDKYRIGVYYGPVWTADINSAYAFALSILPSLRYGTWQHISLPDRSLPGSVRMGLFKVRYNYGLSGYMATNSGIPLPLYQRTTLGRISHPIKNEGWYWNWEAALIASDPRYEIAEAWILDDDGSFPFDWVSEMYDTRLAMQAENNPAEKTLKWILASMYGRVAQRAGWNKKHRTAPAWHQLEWAGMITSICRAMIFMAAMPIAKQGGLISIDTDGVTSTVPFTSLPHGEGNQLGRWKVEEFSGIVYVQNGIYWLRDMDGNWLPPKTRGIPQGKIDDPQVAITAFQTGEPIRLDRHNFVGYGAAIRGRRQDWLSWQDSVYEITPGNSGGRQHVERLCPQCKQGFSLTETLHTVALVPSREDVSAPHRLPWLEAPNDELSRRIRMEMMNEWA
jgi:hypothetical protein